LIPSLIKSLYPISVEDPSSDGGEIQKVRVSRVLLMRLIEGTVGGSAALS